MIIALERFGISAAALQFTKGIYKNHTLETSSSMGKTAEGKVGSGFAKVVPQVPVFL